MPRWISASRLESRLVACVVVGTWMAGSGIDQPARAEWSAIAEQRVSYTTDAFQFSSARRLALSEDPSLPTAVGLGNPEDVIWEPSVEVIRSGTVGLGRNELSVKAHGFIYTDKPIFNHGEYRIQDRQWLNRDTSVLLRYRYLPNLFLGPNFERRSGNRTVQEERVTSHSFRGEFERRLNDQLTATLVGRYGLRFYNEAFAERDTKFYTLGPRVNYRAASWVDFELGYFYERGLADGRQELQFMDDVSYYLHLLSFNTELRLMPKLSLSLLYVYVQKNFTSGITGDTHQGRQDETHQGRAELRYQFAEKAAATLGYQRTQRSSNQASRDFHDNIFSIGGEYRF
ncbi:MAG TPA: outer membrane beta-barrel protein [Nitrospira sp.]|nr:outer membrane beta-barrel protein [Nitrospira sp.]